MRFQEIVLEYGLKLIHSLAWKGHWSRKNSKENYSFHFSPLNLLDQWLPLDPSQILRSCDQEANTSILIQMSSNLYICLEVIHLDRCSWDISSLTLNPGYMSKSTKHLCAIILIFQITVKTWMEYQYTILFHFGHPCLRVQNKSYNKYQILILTVTMHISNSYMYPSWGVRREKCIQKLTRAYT